MKRPISDEDYTKLVNVLGDKLTRDVAESILDGAENLCNYRAVIGQESRVAKLIQDGEVQVFRLKMFEGKRTSFDVEYDPNTKEITRVI